MGLVLLPAATAPTACVVPIPSEEIVPDGGVNSTPVVIATTPPMPGPIDIDPETLPNVSITFRDNNLEQTLHYRIFRDYDKAQLPALNVGSAPVIPNGESDRVVVEATNTWCNGATSGALLVLEVLVADGPISDLNTADPPYRGVAEGTESSVSSWIARCP